MKEIYTVRNPEDRNQGAIAYLMECKPVKPDFLRDNNVWWLTGVATVGFFWPDRPNSRRQGFGREVMKLVLDEADSENVTLILSVEPDNSKDYEWIEAWYKRLGFEHHDELGVSGMFRLPNEKPESPKFTSPNS